MDSAPIKITDVIKDNFLNFFDEKVGIVSEIREIGEILTTSLYTYYASAKFDEDVLCIGSSTAMDRDTALSKAIGECLERYCLSGYNYKSFIQTTCDSVDNRYPCVYPEQAEIYTSEELKRLSFNQYSDSFKTLFCIGYNMAKRNYQYVPLSMVYLRSPYFAEYPQQLNIIQQTISTGAAFGIEFHQTALTGLYEVIERDAMVAFWLLGQQAPKIELETLAPKQQTFIAEITMNDVAIYLFDISLDDTVFVVLSCLRSENPMMPSVVFSAAVHHSIDSAIQKALEEAVSTLGLANALPEKDRKRYSQLLNPEDWNEQIVERNDHVGFWSCHEIFDTFRSKLDFIFKSSTVISRKDLMKRNKDFPDSQSAFYSLVDELAKNDYETLLVDISTSDISSLGFMSLKAIIPGYLPLHLGHRFAYSRPRRLFEIAKSVYKLNLDEITLNTMPHPFP